MESSDFKWFAKVTEAATRGALLKNLLLKISQNLRWTHAPESLF